MQGNRVGISNKLNNSIGQIRDFGGSIIQRMDFNSDILNSTRARSLSSRRLLYDIYVNKNDTLAEMCLPCCQRESYRSDDSRFAPSQWETSLQSNAVSHWLGANLESYRRWQQAFLYGIRIMVRRDLISFRANVGQWVARYLAPSKCSFPLAQYNYDWFY